MKRLFVVLLFFPFVVLATPLCEHISNDPDNRGYNSMSAEDITDDIRGTGPSGDYKLQHVKSMTGRQVFKHVVQTEVAALSEHKRDVFFAYRGVEDIDPWGQDVAVFQWIFGAGSATINALAAARGVDVSPAEFYELGTVKLGHVQGCVQ